jgi:ATP-binding cassette subfamily C (CFTR/MRP) protein 4
MFTFFLHVCCRWLLVYGLLTAGVIVVSLMRSGLFFWATMRAATRLHNSMLLCVLRAPLAFFHTNPAGRVLNRFSNDQVRYGIVC